MRADAPADAVPELESVVFQGLQLFLIDPQFSARAIL